MLFVSNNNMTLLCKSKKQKNSKNDFYPTSHIDIL